jgi:hypothetical protein
MTKAVRSLWLPSCFNHSKTGQIAWFSGHGLNTRHFFVIRIPDTRTTLEEDNIALSHQPEKGTNFNEQVLVHEQINTCN